VEKTGSIKEKMIKSERDQLNIKQRPNTNKTNMPKKGGGSESRNLLRERADLTRGPRKK